MSEPHAIAAGAVVGLGLDLHAVVAELGDELGLDREEVLREGVVQKKTGHQRDGVVAARHLDPRIVVRGERSLQTAAELQLVALLADGGALGTVAGEVEILHLHGDRPDRIVESHLVLPHVDLVDRKLGRSNGSSQKGRQKQEQRTIFHNAEIL